MLYCYGIYTSTARMHCKHAVIDFMVWERVAQVLCSGMSPLPYLGYSAIVPPGPNRPCPSTASTTTCSGSAKWLPTWTASSSKNAANKCSTFKALPSEPCDAFKRHWDSRQCTTRWCRPAYDGMPCREPSTHTPAAQACRRVLTC
jgi:hypothetical protein